jgi:hypothetical protein
MTISPPAKVKNTNYGQVKVLASNIDTLVLAINVEWKNDSFFRYLESMKKIAKDEGKNSSVLMNTKDGYNEFLFNICPYGSNGYEWLLIGPEFSLRIGNWMEPIQRPSIMAQIHSETLWTKGPQLSLERLTNLLNGEGASIVSIRVSRVDPCIDILLPEDSWTMELINFRVTRSKYAAPHFNGKNLTGISIGKGKISARLYDKPLEIKQQSKKYWMFDIWGVKDVPEHYKIIRVEFQLRRRLLIELGIDTELDLFESIGNLWAYCTEKWFKFQDRPGNHHTMRKTLDWWKIVQKGFNGMENPKPMNRSKAFRIKRKQLFNQAYGLITSLQALRMEELGIDLSKRSDFKDVLSTLRMEYILSEKNEENLNDDVFRKRAKYHRAIN